QKNLPISLRDGVDTRIWILRYHFSLSTGAEVHVKRLLTGAGFVFVTLLGVASPRGQAPPATGPVGDVMKSASVKAALAAVKANEPQTIEDQIRFCEIPAPSFKEEVRGAELRKVFQTIGLQNVRVDKVGNVLGTYPGASPHPHLVIAAHLDTVF